MVTKNMGFMGRMGFMIFMIPILPMNPMSLPNPVEFDGIKKPLTTDHRLPRLP